MNDRLFPARPILAVSAAVFRKGRVLIVRRARVPLLGHFSLPGGARRGRRDNGRRARPGAHGRGRRRGGDHRLQPACGSDFHEASRIRTHFVIAPFVARWTRSEPRLSDEVGAVDWIDLAAGLPSPTTPELGEISCARGADRRSDRYRRKMTVDIQPDVAKGRISGSSRCNDKNAQIPAIPPKARRTAHGPKASFERRSRFLSSSESFHIDTSGFGRVFVLGSVAAEVRHGRDPEARRDLGCRRRRLQRGSPAPTRIALSRGCERCAAI